MGAILTTFGIDWHLLLVQGINFGILMAGLTYFLYKPVTRMLEERRAHVEAGVEASAQAQRQLSEMEAQKSAVLAAAGKEADALVAQARAAAVEKGREIVSGADSAAAGILSDAEAQAAQLKAEAVEESKKEVAKLIVLGMEKVLQKK